MFCSRSKSLFHPFAEKKNHPNTFSILSSEHWKYLTCVNIVDVDVDDIVDLDVSIQGCFSFLFSSVSIPVMMTFGLLSV